MPHAEASGIGLCDACLAESIVGVTPLQQGLQLGTDFLHTEYVISIAPANLALVMCTVTLACPADT